MKKYLFLIACMLNTMLASAQFTGSGTGTESDPYRIYNPDQLNQMRNFLKQSGVYFSIEADIDLKDWLTENSPNQGWIPVGTNGAAFQGVVRGNNHIISNLKINRSNNDYIGFWGYIANAKISDITFKNNQVKGSSYCGIFAGQSNASTISNVYLDGNYLEGNNYIGGLIGYSDNNNNSNINLKNTTIKGNTYVGGVIGYSNNDTYSNVYAFYGEISVSGAFCGGFAGYDNYKTNIDNICAYLNINSKSNDVGGIIGKYYSKNYIGSSIENCSFFGTIVGTEHIGGICGYIYAEYGMNSSNTKIVLNNNTVVAHIYASQDYSGGIIGRMESVHGCPIYLTNSSFIGSIEGVNHIGGIVGLSSPSKPNLKVNPTTIEKSYVNAIKIIGKSNVGGILGYATGTATSVKSNIEIAKEISGTSNIHKIGPSNISASQGTQTENKAWALTKVFENGEEKTYEDGIEHGTSTGISTLKLQATYQGLGWDFENDWRIQDTECFPYKPEQTAPPYFTQDIVCGTTTLSGKCIENGTVNITIGNKTYSTVSSGYEWSVNVDKLSTGDEIEISATATDKLPSYTVYTTVKPLGSGTEADPYQVYSAEDLRVIKMNSSDYYKLMNDIDLTSWINTNNPTEGWKPIGSTSAVLMASFDGNGHTVSGLWTNSTADYVGLFAKSNGSTIKNLTVKIADGKKLTGGNYVGAIAAYNNGNIENCKVVGDVSATGNAGGVSGFSSGSITKCTYSGNVTSTDTGSIGGIVGESTGSLSQCCSTDGSVVASGTGAIAGGLCGKSSGSVENCYATVPVTSSAEDTGVSTAGLVGYNEGSVSKCYASGNVESGYKGSGVVGYNYGSNATITNCIGLNKKVSAKNSAFRVVGGYANGAASPGTDNKAIKSMVLSVNGVAMKIYDDPLNGYVIEDSNAKQLATYTGMTWDTGSVWSISEGNSYPYLTGVSEPAIAKTYTLTYIVDSETYKTESYEEGADITPLAEPTKDGYTFSGWSEIPSVMPAKNVTVIGTFTEIPIPSEDTDLSSYDNVMFIEGAEATIGSQKTLSLKMNNMTAMTGFQCDVYMPTGVSVAKEDDFFMIDLSTERTTTKKTNTFDSALQSDGSVRILAGSTKSYTFDGTEGEVATITVDIDKNVTDGSYPLVLKNIVMSDAEGKTYKVSLVKTTLKVSSYTLGDPNNDGSIDIGDYTTIANHILGNDGDVFIEKAADVNCDNDIDVGDLTSEANLILYGSSSAAKSNKVMAKAANDPTGYENIIYIPATAINTGQTKELSVQMKNSVAMTGFQFDIVMPEGLSIDMDDEFYNINLSTERTTAKKTNTFDSALQSDGSVRVLCGSTKSYTFSGNDGEVATITIKAGSNITAGDYTITLKNIVMSDATGKTYKTPLADYVVTVTLPTSIDNIGVNPNAKDGKYIINNRLVIKKGNRLFNAHGEALK